MGCGVGRGVTTTTCTGAGPGSGLPSAAAASLRRPVEVEPVAHGRRRAHEREPEAALAAERQFHGGLLHRRSVEQHPEGEGHEDGDERAGGRPPAPAEGQLCRGRGRSSEAEVEEGGGAGGAEDVEQQEADGEQRPLQRAG